MKTKDENKYKMISKDGSEKIIKPFVKTMSGYVPTKPYKVIDGKLALLMPMPYDNCRLIVISDEEFKQIKKEIKKYKKENKG